MSELDRALHALCAGALVFLDGAGQQRALRAVALRFAAALLESTGEAGTSVPVVLLRQLADEQDCLLAEQLILNHWRTDALAHRRATFERAESQTVERCALAVEAMARMIDANAPDTIELITNVAHMLRGGAWQHFPVEIRP